MPVHETAVVTIMAKAGVIGGLIGSGYDYFIASGMTSYVIGIAFAYIYAMNHKEFRVSFKEDMSVVVLGMTLVYFISRIVPKLLSTVDTFKELGIVSELSNILGVIIGTVILLIVKYWLTIREGVVRDKLDWATSNDRLKNKKDDNYEDFSGYDKSSDYGRGGYND